MELYGLGEGEVERTFGSVMSVMSSTSWNSYCFQNATCAACLHGHQFRVAQPLWTDACYIARKGPNAVPCKRSMIVVRIIVHRQEVPQVSVSFSVLGKEQRKSQLKGLNGQAVELHL